MINFKHNVIGLTLIEVLIALAIISIALTAVIKATSQGIRSTSYLENKTIALWVADEIINEIRLNLAELPQNAEPLQQTVTMLGQNWYLNATETNTPNPMLKKISVQVFDSETAREENDSALMRLESYVHRDEKK